MSQPIRVSAQIGNKTITLETGKLAKQASGAVTVRSGDTIVLVTAVANKEPRVGGDFLPLTVDYIEKTFAAGKIPGGFFKREGRPSEKEILTSRFIDRPIRPLFPDQYFCDVQIIATVLSVDAENDPDVLSIVGASAALMLSGAPFQGPIAGCRIGRVNGEWVLNASAEKMASSSINLVVAGSEDAVVMVEGEAKEVSESEVLEAIKFAHQALQPILKIQKELQAQAGKPKQEIAVSPINEELVQKIKEFAEKKIRELVRIPEKQKYHEALGKLKKEVIQTLNPPDAEHSYEPKQIEGIYEDLKRTAVRELILKDKVRIDGRKLHEIRPISAEVGLLPRTHGSALFTRGETQALVVTTLGTEEDVQIIDTLMVEGDKDFMLHYNFPPFSVGETKSLRSPGRREIGHGALAERAVEMVMPPKEKFPYTVRIVSEILESNGSSSMATVCGATLSLMDAGVKIHAPVAGIAMGLIKEENEVAILSDILGDEDHLGDMDFKVAGTVNGVTAIQMDIKIEGLDYALLSNALEQARVGRLHILGKMAEALDQPREEMSQYAPRVEVLQIPKEKIKDVIGPQGKVIKGIIEATGVKIDINDDGQVNIFSSDPASLEKARNYIRYLTMKPEVGKTYLGTVRKIMDFGAFVEILPGMDGLVHVSQLDTQRVNQVSDIVKEGDEIVVKVLQIDPEGKIRLSRKEALNLEPEIRPIKLAK